MFNRKFIIGISLLLSISVSLFATGAKEIVGEEKQNNFEISIVRWTDAWGTDFSRTAILKELEEKAGVTIDWDVHYYGDWAEQKSLMLASGNLPDAFWGEIALSDTDISQNKEYFVDLTPYIKKYMPNLSAIFKKDPAMKALVTTRDNKIYSLPKKLPMRPITAFETYINKTWLDNLDLQTPDTYQDLENVLTAFVNQDPNKNGKKDEVGFAGQGSCREDINKIMIPFGTQASRNGNFMGLNNNGEPYFVPTANNFFEGTKWINNLYEKGLLSNERFTQTEEMETALTNAEGGSLVGMCIAWTADAGVGGNAEQFEVLKALKGPDGNRYVESDPTYLNYARNEFVVTTACDNIEGLLKFVDQFYDNEVSLQTFYGSINDNKINKTADGYYSIADPGGAMSLDTSFWTYSFRDHGPKYMEESFESKITLPSDQGDGKKLADDLVNRKFAKPNYPVCSFTDEQLGRIALLSTDIKNYVEQTYAKWVVAGGIENEWDSYVDQLNKMGLQEYIEIHKDAYNASYN